ncbi:uncharacterized protein MKK02DRAFT_32862 [Dioszegia hungarica]|uniref:Uncharacterized protein n=1 Tax=Dioszegia hungarica TaxID=4972 RepID=A0AA38LS58_9TREE|nr:uncharacterized protein MKK02DRAFT_32862 [Dioszegia hungarica]KAI9635442.1 hypothetical protein MKK02DRAFT_32862 [Dioszegia hungarica]
MSTTPTLRRVRAHYNLARSADHSSYNYPLPARPAQPDAVKLTRLLERVAAPQTPPIVHSYYSDTGSVGGAPIPQLNEGPQLLHPRPTRLISIPKFMQQIALHASDPTKEADRDIPTPRNTPVTLDGMRQVASKTHPVGFYLPLTPSPPPKPVRPPRNPARLAPSPEVIAPPPSLIVPPVAAITPIAAPVASITGITSPVAAIATVAASVTVAVVTNVAAAFTAAVNGAITATVDTPVDVVGTGLILSDATAVDQDGTTATDGSAADKDNAQADPEPMGWLDWAVGSVHDALGLGSSREVREAREAAEVQGYDMV